MRSFLILGFLAAAASAASLGHTHNLGTTGLTGSIKSTYVQPATTVVSGIGHVGRSVSGTTYVSGHGAIGGAIAKPGSTFISGRSAFGGDDLLQPSSVSFVSGGHSLGGSTGYVQPRSSLQGSSILSTADNSYQTGGSTTFITLDDLDSIPQQVEYNKQVYYFEAPEEQQNQGVINKQLSNILKKNLQVVFIKAPENQAATNAAIQLAKQAIEQRTAIYVLSKENDANQIVGQLQQFQESVQHAPEVAIIKYRTQQDLANAQANIQAQYDSFGGVVPVINGGIVPVLKYSSPAESKTIVLGGGSISGSGSNVLTSSGSLNDISGGSIISSNLGYLPPLKK